MNMTNAKIKKNNQLGMDYGTATHQLRKILMFDMAKRLGEDICYHCKEIIDNIDEFSIEHKENWLDNDPALFWSLDNIAFSHLSCNCSASRYNPVISKISGYRGVFIRPTKTGRGNPFKARMFIDRKEVYLGSFSDPKEAAKVYDEAVLAHYGDRAITNKSLGLL